MKRREFVTSSIAAAGSLALSNTSPAALGGAQQPPQSFTVVPGLTNYVTDFILNAKYEDIPAPVVELGRKSILDGFGLALAGSVSEMGPLIRKYIEAQGISGGKSSVIGTGMKAPARFAALANGVSIHADDYDDTQLSVAPDRVYGLLTHPTVPVLPAIFALAESGRCTGKQLALAYHIGIEVECKIAEAISPRHYNDGFHSTGTMGGFGGAAACAKLLGLNATQTAHALGIAAAQGGGLRDNFGSMTKPYHAGHAAETGVVSAELAALGWTASQQILEAPSGWFHAAGGSYDLGAIQNRLGNPWTFADPGVSIKPFPSGSLTHPAMGEMLRLVREHNIRPADVEKIDVGGNSGMMNALIHHKPADALQGKFSMEYCMTILLLERKAGLTEFLDPVVRRADVQQTIPKVNFYIDPEAERAGLNKMTSLLKIHMKNGSVISGRADFAKGHPANPMSYADEADKFRGCAAFAKWPTDKTESVIRLVPTIETAPNLDALAAALTT
jgi:2-methylcitrate dehydratase PrpD